jgi:pimeloyl-ACP methyl ester carboxylesterase
MFSEMAPDAFDAYLAGAFVAASGPPHRGLALACAPEVEARVYEEAANHDAWGALGQVNCPVRLLGGKESPAVPPGELGLIAGQLPAVQMHVYPALGHFGPFDQPVALAADLAAWALSGFSAPPSAQPAPS